jgi:hypothetical protein
LALNSRATTEGHCRIESPKEQKRQSTIGDIEHNAGATHSPAWTWGFHRLAAFAFAAARAVARLAPVSDPVLRRRTPVSAISRRAGGS